VGFKICWLGFSGRSRDEVLAALHLTDTGILDEANESPISVTSIPNGWTIVWFDRFDSPFAEDASLRLFSSGCTVIAVHVHEGIMFSGAEFYRGGAPVWSVTHNAQAGMYDLETEGTLPEAFAEIRARLTGEQDREGGADAGVDHIFDVPVELAMVLSGFRHDQWDYDWGELRFNEAREQETTH
jgi:hypothetical protein